MDVVFDDTVKVAVLWSVMHKTAQAVSDLQSVVHNKSPGKRMPGSSAAKSPTSVRTSPVARHTWLDEASSSSNTVRRHILADKLRLPNTPGNCTCSLLLFVYLYFCELWNYEFCFSGCIEVKRSSNDFFNIVSHHVCMMTLHLSTILFSKVFHSLALM